MNFFPFHIGDYAAHTRNLSLMEDLAYRRLLDAYYLGEGPLSGCAADVARSIGMRDHLEPVEYVLGLFFENTGVDWKNARADVEIERFREKSEQASRAGRASAERRSNARSTPAAINPTDVADSSTDVQPTITHYPLPITQEPIIQNTHVADAPVDVDHGSEMRLVFEFWKATMGSPASKLDKKRASIIKASLKTGYTADQLCAAISGCAGSEWHMGKNDRSRKFNSLELILRNAEKIDQFIVIGNAPKGASRRSISDISGMDYTKGVKEDGSF